MSFVPIDPSETEFKAPIDETLMEKIRTNFDDHESRLGGGGGGAGGISFKLNGRLDVLRTRILADPETGRVLDGAFVTAGQTFTRARLFMKETGTSGQTRIDIKRHIRVDHPISEIVAQMSDPIDSVGRVGAALSTLAITKRAPDIAIQAVNYALGSQSITSIIDLGSTMRINFAPGTILEADWIVGANVDVTGATNAANNGNFVILEVNPDGYPGLVLDNAAVVTELTTTATANLKIFEYVFTNPVDVNGFVVDENITITGTTIGGNSGNTRIVRVNDSGNNIIAYKASGAVDPIPSGTVETQRFVHTFAAAVLTDDYIVGETMNGSGHTSANNDGNFEIVAINDSGNNLVVINSSGAEQAGAAGSVNTNRWLYGTNADQSGNIAIGDNVEFSGMTSANNDGVFDIKEINKFSLNNLVVFNESGVAQGAPAGVGRSERTLIKFAEDFSAEYEAGRSIVTVIGCANSANNGFWDIVEINRGGGANFNIVALNINSVDQTFPQGQVDLESRSLFDSDLPTVQADERIDFGGATATFNPASVEVDAMVAIDVLEVADGFPTDLAVDLS